jgi:hypothetical protein
MVKCVGYVLFGGNAYGASSMVENGFGFHDVLLGSLVLLAQFILGTKSGFG